MNHFSAAAALVKRAVLSTAGDVVDILDTNRTTVLASKQPAHILKRVVEPDEYQATTAELKVVKLDNELSKLIKAGRYLRHNGVIYKLTSPADPGKFGRFGSNTNHFIYWYIS